MAENPEYDPVTGHRGFFQELAELREIIAEANRLEFEDGEGDT